MATKYNSTPRPVMPRQNSAIANSTNRNRYEHQEDFQEYENTSVNEDEFDDTFVSGYDEDYEEDEDVDATILHNRRESAKSMGGRSRANKTTDRKERSVTGEHNRESGYRQRSGAATPKARKGHTSK